MEKGTSRICLAQKSGDPNAFALGQRPANVTHFLPLYMETIGLDVLEGSRAVNQVSPLLAPPPLLRCSGKAKGLQQVYGRR